LVVIGRADECARIESLLTDARSRRSGVLMLFGEPGVGKSALLSHAVGLSAGMRVLQATGVESEIDLPFAALHELVRPVLHLADRLAGPQAQALLGALGMADHVSRDRFMVAVATLSLLSESAEDGPVLCVVDDAHWLDAPSAEAIAFAARRLDAEGVVALAASREEPWPGLPGLRIGGLGPDEVAEFLRAHAGEVAPDVRDRLVAQTAGNPLALIELARSLTAAQLAGREPLPRQLRFSGRVEDAFLTQVRLLPEETRTLLLVAAVDDTGDPLVVLRAAEHLGVGADALEAAERVGVANVDDGGRIGFRHPLVRAAVSQSATFTARIAAHRALATAFDHDEHAERRAWHLAAAATGPDETVAHDLERSAAQAGQRGAYAVASTAFERAAELSVQRSDRARLTVAAAHAAFHAGQADQAARLADRADRLQDDPVTADELAVLQGRIEFARGSSVTAYALLVSAARGMAERDPSAAAAVLVEAVRAAWNANDPDRCAEAATLLAALRIPTEGLLGPQVLVAIAAGDVMTGQMRRAVARMREANNAWLQVMSVSQATDEHAKFSEAWLALAGFTRVAGDDAAGLTLGTAVVDACRTRGLAAWLPWALVNLAMTEAVAGRHSAAVVNATEALRLASDLRQPMAVCSCESVLAWLAAVRGDEDRCRELADHAVELADTHQYAGIAVFATWALGLLELSLGRPEQALDRLLDRTRGPLAVPGTPLLIGPDVVEAATRAGRTEALDEIVDWYAQWAGGTGQPWAEAAVERCRAMLAADGDAAETHFREALRLHEQAGQAHRPFELARTQLLYGEWLRRARRRAAARLPLTAAHETFERLGATPWSDRAATELRATGQTIPPRDPPASGSHRKRRRWCGSWPREAPTGMSRPNCSSVRVPSPTTCTRRSPSSTSPRAPTSLASTSTH
jgi:tetratricopeptide (TPR) repeat protein